MKLVWDAHHIDNGRREGGGSSEVDDNWWHSVDGRSSLSTPPVLGREEREAHPMFHAFFRCCCFVFWDRIMEWITNRTRDYPDVNVTNFTESLADGRALLAILEDYNPSECPYGPSANPAENLRRYGVHINSRSMPGRASVRVSDVLIQ